MLLNEFLKEHRNKNEEQEATNRTPSKKQIDATYRRGLQKVRRTA